MHPTPNRTIDKLLTTCPKCEVVLPEASQTPQQVYERIELPPILPDVTQILLFDGRCAYCSERVTAQAPAELEPGSPFGHSTPRRWCICITLTPSAWGGWRC